MIFPGQHAPVRWFLVMALVGVAAVPARAASLRLEIRHEIDGGAIEYGAVKYRNGSGEAYSVVRLSYFVSGFALRRPDGSWMEPADSTEWIDAPTGRTEVMLAEVPPGEYGALRFFVGLDPVENASDPASHAPGHALNPNLNGLFWSWQGGYIFMAFEGLFRGAEAAESRGFAWHLARDPFRTEVVTNGNLKVEGESEIAVRFDVGALFDGATRLSLAGDGASTHSKDGDPVALGMRRNVAAAFQLEAAAGAAAPADASRAVADEAGAAPGYGVPDAFPRPGLPADNPPNAARKGLGIKLFHEKDLSVDGTISCASCHDAEAALGGPERFSTGVDGQVGHRQAMPLFNLAWKREFFWDGRAPSLRAQVLVPIEDPIEMGETLDGVIAKLEGRADYAEAFEKAFGSREVTAERIGLAVENFLLTLVSYDSKFDRARRGLETLSAEEQRGFELFMTEREPRLGSFGADCFHCHGGPLFTDHQFRNNGLAIDESDTGRERVTGASLDRGAFATPSLRNVALTAPYMHDGRFATLEEVLDHYSEGVERTATLDPNLAKHPDGGLNLSAADKRAVIAFLKTLTDARFAREAR